MAQFLSMYQGYHPHQYHYGYYTPQYAYAQQHMMQQVPVPSESDILPDTTVNKKKETPYLRYLAKVLSKQLFSMHKSHTEPVPIASLFSGQTDYSEAFMSSLIKDTVSQIEGVLNVATEIGCSEKVLRWTARLLKFETHRLRVYSFDKDGLVEPGAENEEEDWYAEEGNLVLISTEKRVNLSTVNKVPSSLSEPLAILGVTSQTRRYVPSDCDDKLGSSRAPREIFVSSIFDESLNHHLNSGSVLNVRFLTSLRSQISQVLAVHSGSIPSHILNPQKIKGPAQSSSKPTTFTGLFPSLSSLSDKPSESETLTLVHSPSLPHSSSLLLSLLASNTKSHARILISVPDTRTLLALSTSLSATTHNMLICCPLDSVSLLPKKLIKHTMLGALAQFLRSKEERQKEAAKSEDFEEMGLSVACSVQAGRDLAEGSRRGPGGVGRGRTAEGIALTKRKRELEEKIRRGKEGLEKVLMGIPESAIKDVVSKAQIVLARVQDLAAVELSRSMGLAGILKLAKEGHKSQKPETENTDDKEKPEIKPSQLLGKFDAVFNLGAGDEIGGSIPEPISIIPFSISANRYIIMGRVKGFKESSSESKTASQEDVAEDDEEELINTSQRPLLKFTKKLVSMLISKVTESTKSPLSPSRIGILTPFREHARRLKSQIHRELSPHIEVSTYTSYLFNPKDILILNLVRSSSLRPSSRNPYNPDTETEQLSDLNAGAAVLRGGRFGIFVVGHLGVMVKQGGEGWRNWVGELVRDGRVKKVAAEIPEVSKVPEPETPKAEDKKEGAAEAGKDDLLVKEKEVRPKLDTRSAESPEVQKLFQSVIDELSLKMDKKQRCLGDTTLYADLMESSKIEEEPSPVEPQTNQPDVKVGIEKTGEDESKVIAMKSASSQKPSRRTDEKASEVQKHPRERSTHHRKRMKGKNPSEEEDSSDEIDSQFRYLGLGKKTEMLDDDHHLDPERVYARRGKESKVLEEEEEFLGKREREDRGYHYPASSSSGLYGRRDHGRRDHTNPAEDLVVVAPGLAGTQDPVSD